jgi:hypothetical protein
MSSLLASLDMSLDDIISNKKKNKDSRPAKMQDNRGPPGRDRRSKKPQRRNQPYSRPVSASSQAITNPELSLSRCIVCLFFLV